MDEYLTSLIDSIELLQHSLLDPRLSDEARSSLQSELFDWLERLIDYRRS